MNAIEVSEDYTVLESKIFHMIPETRQQVYIIVSAI